MHIRTCVQTQRYAHACEPACEHVGECVWDVSAACRGVYECLRVQTCIHGCTPIWGEGMPLCTHLASSGTWGGRGGSPLCPPCPSHARPPREPPPGDPVGASPARGVAAGTGPSGASGAGGTCGSQQPLSPVPPRDSDAPGAARGAQPEPPNTAGALHSRGALPCPPGPWGSRGCSCQGQGAAVGQPPHRSPPQQPDAGQCREEIQALSGGWLQPLPQPRPLA